MEAIFDVYAGYYDLLYRDKDYDGEALFVNGLLRKQAPEAARLLELGCGTGIHAGKLAALGYSVHGIDISRAMLEQAKERLKSLPEEHSRRLSFAYGDIREFHHDGSFDAAISLFHVMSYQTHNDDLTRAFAGVKQHINPKGVFIFDCWYGPAVLNDPPVVRVKRMENNQIEAVRIAEPEILPNENRVNVHYQVFIKNKATGKIEIFKETHKVRYLFMPEIEQLCKAVGFALIDAREWMTDKEPGMDTWGVYFVAGA